jgi:RNA polymerase sigma-70 factor (ECF subfamily)
MQENEDELLRRAQAGDGAALNTLFADHVNYMFNVVKAFRGSLQDADIDEIVQDAAMRASANLGKFDGRSEFKTWLTAIVRHSALDHHRRRRKHGDPAREGLEYLVDPDVKSPSLPLRKDERKARFLRALTSLPQELADIIRWRVVENRKFDHIQTEKGVKMGTAHARLKRALTTLREKLRECGVGSSDFYSDG